MLFTQDFNTLNKDLKLSQGYIDVMLCLQVVDALYKPLQIKL